MQEPGDMRNIGGFNLADHFPVGKVIEQEETPPHRVKVRIPAKHRGIEDADLPYFRVGFAVGNNGHNGRSGSYGTLAHGTEVIVMLYDKMGYNGIVFVQLSNSANDIHGDNDLYGYRDELGNSFNVDKDGKMTMTDKAGASVSMGNGVIDIKASELHVQVGDLTLSGDMFTALFESIMQTSTDLTLSASNPTILDGSGGGGGSSSAPTLTAPELPEAPDIHDKTDL